MSRFETLGDVAIVPGARAGFARMQDVNQTGVIREATRSLRPLELRQYRYFVVLAEELHFARAAERLGVGQSNLSREVKALERQLRLRLFYRTSRHTELTAAGERFIDSARRVLAAEEHARLAASELRRSTRERLRIGICERIASSRIAAVLTAWRGANPTIDLRIVSRSGRALIEEIESGLLDAGITAMQVAESGLLVEQLWTDPWVAALQNGHALASTRTIELAELTHEPVALLVSDAGGVLERRIVEALGSIDPHVFIAERPSSVVALLTWVEAGCGVGLLTASQAEAVAHPNVILRSIRRGLPPADVIVLRNDSAPTPPLSRLIECLRASPG